MCFWLGGCKRGANNQNSNSILCTILLCFFALSGKGDT
jgi:hypothetical protein